MHKTVEQALLPDPESKAYAELPAFIRSHTTLKEYLWLGDEEKSRLVQDETEPEA